MNAIGPDGHAAKGEFLPPVPLPRRMWAGGTIETHRAAAQRRCRRPAARPSATFPTRTAAPGRSASSRSIMRSSTERGVALRERHNIVYREAAKPGDPAAAAPRPAPSPRAADLAWEVEADPGLPVPLFGDHLQQPPHPLRSPLCHELNGSVLTTYAPSFRTQRSGDPESIVEFGALRWIPDLRR
jgi:hypothetical protein